MCRVYVAHGPLLTLVFPAANGGKGEKPEGMVLKLREVKLQQSCMIR